MFGCVKSESRMLKLVDFCGSTCSRLKSGSKSEALRNFIDIWFYLITMVIDNGK